MADAVLFDLDETLLDRTVSLRAFLRDQFERFATDLGAIDYPAWEVRFLERDARGSVPKAQVYPALLDVFGVDVGVAERLAADYALNCCRHARPFDGMAETLAALRRAGKRLGIVTNGESVFQRRHIQALNLTALVDDVLVSGEEGLRKPDVRLFTLAATRLGVSPSRCLFVGDNPSADVLGAADAGMATAWFRCGQTWPADLRANPGPTIEHLSEAIALASPPMKLTSTIRAYDPVWPQQYADAAASLAPIFAGRLLEMHHVGSTAVPQLSAKPEIDILIVVATTETPEVWVEALAGLGYRRGGDLSPGHRFFKRDVHGVRTHKIHLCVVDHPGIRRMLSFRDHMRAHPDDRVAYETLKLRLERDGAGGVAEYLAAKRPFIDGIVAKAGS